MNSLNPDVVLDAQRLTDWVGDRLPGHGPIRAQRMGEETGTANALFFLDRDDPASPTGSTRWVLRRPPLKIIAPGASDIEREWRILTALEGTDVPHAAPLLVSLDSEAIGAPFIIMDVVDGFTPIGDLPAPYDQPERRHELSLAIVDAIVSLGAVDWRAGGLEGLGKPDGFLERQVPRWLAQLDRYRRREIPLLDTVADWLTANRPAPGPAGLMHGDYSPFNVMASPTDATRLAAVIDWDTGTVGDPLLDIGHLLARWTNPGEEPTIVAPIDFHDRVGFATRAEMAKRYEERSGLDLSALSYYQTLALFKLGIILEGNVTRATEAGAPEAAGLLHRVDRLIRFADMFARGERS